MDWLTVAFERPAYLLLLLVVPAVWLIGRLVGRGWSQAWASSRLLKAKRSASQQRRKLS